MHRKHSLDFAPRGLGLAGILAAITLLGAGCKPDYPTCETDKDCHEKEFCVGRKCEQCRDAKDCAEGQACNAGKCEAIAGYCKSKADCPANQACIANKCQACKGDKDCAGGFCVKGACSPSTSTSRRSRPTRRRRSPTTASASRRSAAS
jgi:hypothetical protein